MCDLRPRFDDTLSILDTPKHSFVRFRISKERQREQVLLLHFAVALRCFDSSALYARHGLFP